MVKVENLTVYIFVCSRRKTVPVHVVGVRVEFRAVGRADQTLPEAHGRQTLPLRSVRTVFRAVRSSGAAQEEASAQERGRVAASATAADHGPPSYGRRQACRGPTTETTSADDAERRRRRWRDVIRPVGRSAAGQANNGARVRGEYPSRDFGRSGPVSGGLHDN